MVKKGHSNFGYKLLGFLIVLITLVQVFTAHGFVNPFISPDPKPDDSTHFPQQEGAQQEIKKPIELNAPSNIKNETTYDPKDKTFNFSQKVGDNDIRAPFSMNDTNYYKYRFQQDESDYWKQRLDALSMFNHKPKLPELSRVGLFDRLFGGNKISVTPQGNMDLTFGGSWQNLKNPNLIQSQQKYGIFDFDMNMNINLIAKIGEKLKLNISNSTLSSFGQQNTKKIEYSGDKDVIVKKVEAGNVSFPLTSTLLTGPLSLFGIKTELQFGKLRVTGVLSQQQSQRKTINVQGGAQKTDFEIKADAYDENKNFFLGQYFHGNYEKALVKYPIINSQVTLTAVQVWITNRTGATQNVRDIVAFMDLGESKPYLPNLTDPNSKPLPDNRANRLYDMLMQSPGARQQATATQNMLGLGLQDGQDFQRSTMRQLNSTEFTFQPQLGYISLNTQVNPDDILAVAYRYTYNGKVYQVGEFAEDIPPDSTSQKVLFLKLLKGGTSGRPTLPIWDLMMKNVYTIGYGGNISSQNFKLNVYYQDPGGGEKTYLPDGPSAGVPLIKLLNLDRLNSQNDPSPDGVFDFVEGITVIAQQGKIIFPVLEPFGKALEPALGGNAQLEKRYLYQVLYDSTKSIAQQFQQNNRFLIKGSYEGSSGSEIRLGGYNIPQGSVSVTAGGQRLTEGSDYQVNYSSGSVTILNQGILSSGIPIAISFEDNASFSFVQQNFWGVRMDYFLNNHLTIGSTLMRLTEKPYTQKVLFGDDPIKNTVLGLDGNYQNEFPALTRFLDNLPLISTSAPSLISLSAEVAGIYPGHQRFINSLDPEGSAYIDDFEGSNSGTDLRFPANSWSLSSAPVDARNANGIELFPEAKNPDLTNGKNRAKLAWYMLDPSLVDGNSQTPPNIKKDTTRQSYWRLVQQQDLFPQKVLPIGQNYLPTLDLSFYPNKRGPYNFDDNAANINPSNGEFLNPSARFGGIQKAIENSNSDFEAANVEYITFWVMDPFLYDPNDAGDLYINLGNVSEDVLKDGRLSFENGIPYPKDLSKLDVTTFGYVPRFQQQITRSFDNDPAARKVQDVGYDELNDDEERIFFKNFLTNMQSIVSPAAFQKLDNDPASDNFHPFRGTDYDADGVGPIDRYTDYNNPSGNSPVADASTQYAVSGTSIPESEDINKDNTLNETEAYFQYRVHLKPNMNVGDGFITDKRTLSVKQLDGRTQVENWYQYKIPIKGYDHAVGGISDFRSIRFMRMFLAGFQDTSNVVLRFAQIQLDRNNWRQYLFSLTAPGENIPQQDLLTTSFSVSSVSLEENFTKSPIPYRMPPGVARVQTPSGISGQNLQQDEQSMSFQICGLKDGDSRAAFKEINIDMRQNKYLRMFVHAESVPNEMSLKDGDLKAFIRIGSDFINNYYEYEIPLKISPNGSDINTDIWPTENEMDIDLQQLIDAKTKRNNQNLPTYLPYQTVDNQGRAIIVVGNPNLGQVKDVMLGVKNPKKTLNNPNDDGLRKCSEVWFDELRLAGFDEKPAYAAAGQANIQLADIGNVHLGGSMHTIGYGNIDQKSDDRNKDNFYTYDATTNLQLGKILPKNWGLQLPVFAGYTQMVSKPQYNPYDEDVLLSEELSKLQSAAKRDSLKSVTEDFNSITSLNFTNVRYLGNPQKQPKVVMPWSLRNFNLSYSYNNNFKHSPMMTRDELTDQHLNLGYAYSIKAKQIEPFKKLIKSKSKWLAPIKDFNFNLLPSSFTFNNQIHRLYGVTQVRNIDDGPYQLPATYYKDFTWERDYNLRWELTKSLSFNYTALNQSRIDEPDGPNNRAEERDSVWSNLRKFGRNTYYNQSLRVDYTLPTKKIPALDWTSIKASYGSTYNWTGSSLLASELGNIIANTQTRTLNGEFNFTQLYNKSRWLRAINTPKVRAGQNEQKMNSKPMAINMDGKGSNEKEEIQPREKPSRSQTVPPRPKKKKITKDEVKGKDTLSNHETNVAYRTLKKTERRRFKKELRAWRVKRNRINPEISDGLRTIGKIATMLKRVSVNYSDNSGTTLPGFMDSTQYFGVNNRSSNNWYDFAFGGQPGQAWLNQQALDNRITRDSIFNGQLQQTYVQNYNIAATVEPIQDLRIDLTWTRQFSKNYSETFKYDDQLSSFEHFSPYSLGTFSVSYIGIKTIFSRTYASAPSQLYNNFMAYRSEISTRLGIINPYTDGLNDPQNPNYKKGYTQYAQDVLIPAFLAAYGGRDVKDIPLVNESNSSIRSNPFSGYTPLPNWRLTYNGLNKLPFFQDILQSFTLSNSYTGNLSMNSFVSSFFYQDLLSVGFPSFIDSNSHNYVPFFSVPNITISENFGPLIGFDAKFISGLDLSFKFNKSRMLSLSLVDFQVSEQKSSEVIFGGGYRLKGLRFPVPIFGITELKNDINFRMDLGFRNDITNNSYLAQNAVIPTRGQKVITISPSIDYIINQSLQIKFFYDRTQTIPALSTSFPITNTRAGLTLRFLFAP